MKNKYIYRIFIAFLLFSILSAGFAACNTDQPVSSLYGDPVIIGAEENITAGNSQDSSIQSLYYSCTAYDFQNKKSYFLYGPERNMVAEAALSSQEGNFSPSLYADVVACPAPVSGFYYATFAGHGLLAGIVNNDTEMTIYISRDNGAHWESVALPINPLDQDDSDWTNLGFTSATEGWIASYNPLDGTSGVMRFLFTQDGGKTWQQTAEQKIDGYGKALFVTAEHGYMSAYTEQGGPLLETWDGGSTWQSCPISSPPGFSIDSSKHYVVEFLRNSQGYYCILNSFFEDTNENNVWLNNVQLPLSAKLDGKTTTWSFEGAWDFPAQTDPIAFFRYVESHLYYPDYYGIDYYEGESHLSHQFLHHAQDYATKYKPGEITVINGTDGYQEDVLSTKLITDLLALTYNLHNFDVTTLADYRQDVQGFAISHGCAHGGTFQDVVYHSVQVTSDGNIELIRDVVDRSEGVRVDRNSGDAKTLVERCVFKPITSASGVKMFTIIECEYLENYPYAAQ